MEDFNAPLGQAKATFYGFQNPKDPSQRRHVPPEIARPNYADDSQSALQLREHLLSTISVNGDPKYSRLEKTGQARPRELESWEQEGMRRVCKVRQNTSNT